MNISATVGAAGGLVGDTPCRDFAGDACSGVGCATAEPRGVAKDVERDRSASDFTGTAVESTPEGDCMGSTRERDAVEVWMEGVPREAIDRAGESTDRSDRAERGVPGALRMDLEATDDDAMEHTGAGSVSNLSKVLW